MGGMASVADSTEPGENDPRSFLRTDVVSTCASFVKVLRVPSIVNGIWGCKVAHGSEERGGEVIEIDEHGREGTEMEAEVGHAGMGVDTEGGKGQVSR